MTKFLLPALLAAAASALACLALARLARGLGWLDGPDGPAGRKLQRRPVPPVGGAAIAVGLAAGALAMRGAPPAPAVLGLAPVGPAAALAALFLAFGAGTLDDLWRGGLGPAAKLGLQLTSGLPLALDAASREASSGSASLVGLGVLLVVVAALNVANTFDHADGLLGGASLLGLFAAGSPVAAGAVAGFLPCNLRPRSHRGAHEPPAAYLGDAGSHLLGLLLILVPGAWPALVLAGLDLARLSFVRLAAGSRPWIGDRRHVGHLLACGGRSPFAVAGLLAGVQAPLVVGLAWYERSSRGTALLVAPLAGAAALALVLLFARGARREAAAGTRAASPPGRPCPLPPAAE